MYSQTSFSCRRASSSTGLLSELRAGGQDQLESQDMAYNEKRAWDDAYTVPELDEDENPVDVLDYWKKNANAYPTIAMIARDLLAVPVSTVPSESCFSSANRILTDKRTKLGTTRFEQLVCLKDWIDAEDRMQPIEEVQASTVNIPSQESASNRSSPDDDESDGAYDEVEWYLRRSRNF